MWLYGTGFPKSLDVSKAIDKAAGAEREVVGSKRVSRILNEVDLRVHTYATGLLGRSGEVDVTVASTPEAERWSGWGTALKPAWEPIVLARKPLCGAVAQNVQAHRTGAINVDGCRVRRSESDRFEYGVSGDEAPSVSPAHGSIGRHAYLVHDEGRWPANLVLDEESSEMLDEQSGQSSTKRNENPSDCGGNTWGGTIQTRRGPRGYTDCGGASRFFYCAKATREERDRGCEGLLPRSGASAVDREEGSAGTKSPRAGAGRSADTVRNYHPTVKPLNLMRWLCRLVTPPGGIVLDPFSGSGTTGCAARLEGFRFIGFDLDEGYCQIANARIAAAAEDAGDAPADDTRDGQQLGLLGRE
ncbi:MAG: site-specific DNA-methyltransferase [Deltaproteobacteria bacterium]|nr:site-specific DNA-methyltransferase [Deltaproteobacteria bacterium]